eukprot:gb/GECH01009850.1/.p1 GENE.gb/GECH01009850.1/~~gb/GECH01009850.1/.p1  ORF type:complete len:383 (+),score=73.80 gb/GECH01009850.1/:1-1149(+)
MRFLANAIFGRRTSLVSTIGKEAASAYRLSFLTAGIRSGLLARLRQPHTFEDLVKEHVRPPTDDGGTDSKTAMEVRERALDDFLNIGIDLGELRRAKGKYSLYGDLAKDLAEEENESAAMLTVEAHEVHLPTIARSMELLASGASQPLSPEVQDITNATRNIASFAWEEIIRRTVPQEGHLRVLEVSCGPEPGAVDLCLRNPDAAVIAIDSNPRCVEQAQKYVKDLDLSDRLSVHQLSLSDVQSSQGPLFDAAIMNNRLHTIAAAEQSQVIRDVYRLLKEDSEVLVAQNVSDDRDIYTDATDLWTCLTTGMSPLPTSETLKTWLMLPGFAQVSVRQLPFVKGLVYATAVKESAMAGLGDSTGGTSLASDLPQEGNATNDNRN